jgi:hypothetical protein
MAAMIRQIDRIDFGVSKLDTSRTLAHVLAQGILLH